MSKGKKTLEEVLHAAMRSIPGASCLDDSTPTDKPTPSRADYLMGSGRVVVEIKNLEDSRDSIVSKAIADFQADTRWRPLVRDMDWAEVVAYQPHGRELQQEITRRATKHIEPFVRKAQKQVRNTLQQHGLAESQGLLVVINGAAPVLDAKVLLGTLNRLLQLTTDGSTFRYPDLHGLLLLSGVDLVRNSDGSHDSPCIFSKRLACSAFVEKAADEIIDAWATLNGKPLLRNNAIATGAGLASLDITSIVPPLEV